MSLINLHIIKAGFNTLIQDNGRISSVDFGIPISGHSDKGAAGKANELVGNAHNTPVLECTLTGPTIRFPAPTQISITGAECTPLLNDTPLSSYQTINVDTGDILSIGNITNGLRTYIGIRGKWNVPSWMDSCSYCVSSPHILPSSLLKDGQLIKIKSTGKTELKSEYIKFIKYKSPLKINILPGPEYDSFSKEVLESLFTKSFVITNEFNRMGIKLSPYLPCTDNDIISSGIIPGTIQVSNSGQPIILFNDTGTTGGYKRIGNIIKEDLDKIAQLKSGDSIYFSLTNWDK